MHTLILVPTLDDRYGPGKVTSRIGIESEAQAFGVGDDLLALVRAECQKELLHCVLVDEAQFLSKAQVYQLSEVCDCDDIPVLAYGLRTDFRGEPFEGSRYLLAWADNLKEIKAICHCGSKATMVIRAGADGRALSVGSQVEIGGDERYVSLCRTHFKASFDDRGRSFTDSVRRDNGNSDLCKS